MMVSGIVGMIAGDTDHPQIFGTLAGAVAGLLLSALAGLLLSALAIQLFGDHRIVWLCVFVATDFTDCTDEEVGFAVLFFIRVLRVIRG